MKLLRDKVAIVSGASSGIGRAAAMLFSQHGARVVATARRERELSDVVDKITRAGGEACLVAGDVRVEELHERCVTEALDRFGGLHIAFNNAGWLGEMGPAETLSRQGWTETLETNLTGAFLAAKHQLPAIERSGGGSVIFTSTFVGHTLGFPGMGAYAAAKAGLVGLMRVLAVEYAARGIRVNALLPGGVDTPMGDEGAGSSENLAFIKSLHAMKRIATPEEIANSAIYLASDLSSFVTGSTLVVDGGVTIART
jgi:NAD(P)-dependent dehydrogenase (short-subunit alcohol dehydrogenase family)